MMETLIRQGLAEYGLEERVPPEAAAQLAEYGRRLLEKNTVMNLTAITDPAEVARLHMLDCAALLNVCALEGLRLLDVGTGAGFPGLVLKILVPSLDVTLLDSLQKRLTWLEEVCAALGLKGVRTVHARAEELAAEKEYRERFDVVTSRAVADLRVLSELCLPYVKEGGKMVAMKSVQSGAEAEGAAHAAAVLGGRLEEGWDYRIPGTEIIHRVVMVGKTAPTPARYPRRFGQIKKAPL